MVDPRATSGRMSTQAFVERIFVVVAVGALVAAVWALSDLLLLMFGAILFAVMLHSVSVPLQSNLRIGRTAALVLSGGLIAALLVAMIAYLGPEIARQMRGLLENLPKATARLTGNLHIGSLADLVKNGAASPLGGLVARLVSWSATAAGAFGSLLLVIFGGIYLAGNPSLYRDGFVKLVPPAVQPNVEATLDDAGKALRRWLAGQLIAMVLVGVCTSAGLWLIGVPSPFALGLIAGLAEFVPIIGPIVAAIPAILIASTQDWQTALLAVAVFVVVQQVESNIITPLIADRMVSIAPAVGLFAVVAMGVLLGPLGLLLGFPLAIVFDVAVRRLYVRDALGEQVEIMGRPAKPS